MNYQVMIERFERWQTDLERYGFYDNTALDWVYAGAVLLVALLVFYIIKWVTARRVARLAERTTRTWDDALVDVVQQTRGWFMLILAAFLGSRTLQLPPYVHDVLQMIAVLTLIVQAGLWGNVLITGGVQRHVQRRMKDDPASVMTIMALAFIGKLVLFTTLLLLALDNMGIEVTALIAGLGVGGIAVALAVQNVLGDLLASLSIVFDKPFVPGDFIVVGDQLGVVEKIGLKTTRLKSLSGEQLIFPNNDLLQSRVRNFKRMTERRVVFELAVSYKTPRHLLRQIPQMVREIIEHEPDTRFDRAHFKEFGSFALNFEVVYYVLSADFNLYMDRQQAINLAIHERFEHHGIEFAYPTQMLYIERIGGAGAEAAEGGGGAQ